MTVVSAKGKKFGGFAARSWNESGAWQHSVGNFLFMLEPCIKLDCHKTHRAQSSHTDCGPYFGEGDLYISGGCLNNSFSHAHTGDVYGERVRFSAYGEGQEENCEHFRNMGEFQVTDYEVFAVKETQLIFFPQSVQRN